MDTKIIRCYFCGSSDLKNVDKNYYPDKPRSYTCAVCGHIFLDLDPSLSQDIELRNFTEEEKKIISIVIRNEYEKRSKERFDKRLTIEDLNQIIEQYHRYDALDKMDIALLNLERSSEYIGSNIRITPRFDFPYYHCFDEGELVSILRLLAEDGFVKHHQRSPTRGLRIARKGYQRLRELKKHKDSRQCFVAMWLAPELNHVYEEAIEPGIEYIEEGEKEPRFKALRIDNKEHTNDINDEIIGEIRRSRFIVCDLTGYRGGVYWEAGFAYGLGLEVIYTCREDWLKEENLYNSKKNGRKVIKELYDENGKKINIKKEGIHFDLEHRNRISWNESDLESFKDRLTKRIKAVII